MRGGQGKREGEMREDGEKLGKREEKGGGKGKF